MPLKYLVCTNFVNVCANISIDMYRKQNMYMSMNEWVHLKDTLWSGVDAWGK